MLECATPLTIRGFCNTLFGSLYGTKTGQFNPLPITKSEGPFLAGQGTVGPETPSTRISAFPAREFTLEHNKLSVFMMGIRVLP